VIDEISLDLVKGSTVEFTEELIGSKFALVGNPNAESGCGCGTSFNLKG
jgi:iron-sulfur cluster assembly accessory protein